MQRLPCVFHLVWSNWSPFGDKTPVGWTVTIAYFVVTGLSYWAYKSECRAMARGTAGVSARFWYWLTCLMLALGINKQLDLQRLVTRFGRILAIVTHVYSLRRPFQAAFIGLIAIVGLILIAVLASHMRGLRQRYFVALCGMVFLAVFVIIRAASFHYVDRLLGMRFHNVYVNTFLELGGIIWIGAAALTAIRHDRRLNGSENRAKP